MTRRLHILVLSGPTREYIDPVRYLSNASTGRQGAALALEALGRGHEVDLVQGPVAVEPPAGANVYPVVSAQEMFETAKARHAFCDVLIGAAAVTDYRPVTVSAHKRKRGKDPWRLELEPTTDILASLAAQKGLRVHVGFALETENLLENALRKLLEKGLDWIVVNDPAAIGADEGEYHILGADSTKFSLGSVSKAELAEKLLDVVERTAATRCV